MPRMSAKMVAAAMAMSTAAHSGQPAIVAMAKP